jgi:hypothetical protein
VLAQNGEASGLVPEVLHEEVELLHALDEPKSMPALQQELDYTTAERQDIVSRLEEKDAIERTDDCIGRLSTTI